MSSLNIVTSRAIPFVENNVDTDQLLPKQFLTEITRTGFGKHLLHDIRYLDKHEAVPNPNCILNDAAYAGANILIAGENFGCGSSREHAPWAIADFGIQVIIAVSFADIFYANCLNNQILPVALSKAHVLKIAEQCFVSPQTQVTVDLTSQTVTVNDLQVSFDVPAHHKRNLLNGVDKIGRTLQEDAAIAAFERNQNSQMQRVSG